MAEYVAVRYSLIFRPEWVKRSLVRRPIHMCLGHVLVTQGECADCDRAPGTYQYKEPLTVHLARKDGPCLQVKASACHGCGEY